MSNKNSTRGKGKAERRSCLCEDGQTYSPKCCGKGHTLEQGIGNTRQVNPIPEPES
jgi:hypothetical protein